MPASDLRVLTNSEMKCFRRCPREHWLQYRQMIRVVESADALRFGTLIHAALEAWWSATEMRLQAALTAIAEAKVSDPFERARAEAMVIAYDTRWRDEPYETLAVEMKFNTPIVNPATGAASRTFMLQGKIDGLVRHIPSGRIFVLEHKTTSESFEPGSSYIQRLRLDSQVSVYYSALRDLRYDVSGVIYDVLAKPRHAPYKATPEADRRYVVDKATKEKRLDARQREADETVEAYQDRILEAIAKEPDRYFARAEVVRLEAEEIEARADLWMTTQAMRESERLDRHPRNPDSCHSFSRLCWAFPLCTGEASADDTTRFRRAESAHEELT